MTPHRLLRLLLITALVGALLWLALRPSAVLVDAEALSRGSVVEAFEAEGRTRLHERHVLHAPFAADAARLLLQPGDAVRQGDPVVLLAPLRQTLQDSPARAELAARLAAAERHAAALAAQSAAAQAAADRAAREAGRIDALAARALASTDAADRARSDATLRAREADAAAQARRAATYERDALQAALQRRDGGSSEQVTLRAPLDGVLVRRHFESARPVQAGEALLEIGDPADLEVEVDVLSADAVRLRPGLPVTLLRWGGDAALPARVARIEPGGFTKISALGVEEQRVWVIVRFDAPPPPALGDAFRVHAQFELAREDDVLRVPASALFAQGDGWAVFRIVDGHARSVPVQVGLRGGRWAVLRGGLDPGAVVVLHPDGALRDGARVARR